MTATTAVRILPTDAVRLLYRLKRRASDRVGIGGTVYDRYSLPGDPSRYDVIACHTLTERWARGDLSDERCVLEITQRDLGAVRLAIRREAAAVAPGLQRCRLARVAQRRLGVILTDSVTASERPVIVWEGPTASCDAAQILEQVYNVRYRFLDYHEMDVEADANLFCVALRYRDGPLYPGDVVDAAVAWWEKSAKQSGWKADTCTYGRLDGTHSYTSHRRGDVMTKDPVLIPEPRRVQQSSSQSRQRLHLASARPHLHGADRTLGRDGL